MTTLLEDIQAVLNPLVTGGSSYLRNEAQPPVYPYIVFAFVVSTANVALRGRSDLQNTRVQVDIYSRTVAELDALGNALLAAMDASALDSIPLSQLDLDEPDIRAFRRTQDFSIWARN